MQEDKELLVAQLYFTAVFPVIKVLLNDDPAIKKKFANVQTAVVFKAKNKDEYIGCTLFFDRGDFKVEQNISAKPDIQFNFSSVAKMNIFLKGGVALPKIKGLTKPGLLVKVVGILLRLMLMMPSKQPKKSLEKYLKVKMSFYMVTTALSKLNKMGDEEMKNWTSPQPDRVYQISVDNSDIACYFRVKAGKSKSARGIYARKRPFLHMKFGSVDGAMAVLLRDAEFVDAVDKEYVEIIGSPEYAAQLNDFMMRIQALTT